MKSRKDTFIFLLGLIVFNAANFNVTAQNTTVSIRQTGQMKSYAQGDDGDLQKGTQLPANRFKDNGNGTINDNLTGLVWMKNVTVVGKLSWLEAIDACNSLKHGMHGLTDESKEGDWRLPNRLELESLMDYSIYRGPSKPFMNTADGFVYWSSTTSAKHTDKAWKVDLTGGNVGGGYIMEGNKIDFFWAWPVRDQ